ncbi:MAG: phosphatidylinositol kinase, partial [Planctomycetes bacterium]|nr:phosphatidylinositol kinase [Planctomycetota bacterium]
MSEPSALRQVPVFFDRKRCGVLSEIETGFEFVYESGWLADAKAQPISLTMPLRAEPYESRVLFPFFLGLLPEGWLLDVSLAKLKLSADDTFGVLAALCRDC